MDKKSKEALRRYKKSRRARSSESSSSSDSDSGSSSSSYSSTDSERKAAQRHRKKKSRQEKREHCQKKLEAKRNHLKRKLKEAKLKKRAAAAAAALSGHSHRALSPATQAKLKKLAERKHQRAVSKERREREREKHRAAVRERERDHHRIGSHSPTKITKIRIHQDVKRQKTPPRVHHQLMSREKIIIQTRTRDRTPSAERRHEHKLRHDELARDRERRERERDREAARDKERAEALARCQERQRERERLAREKMRREEEEKKYAMAPRLADREIAMANVRSYSRERSIEAVDRARHLSKRELEAYEREREYLEAERRGLIDRDREELRREREYLAARRRELSPIVDPYVSRIREHRDLYVEEERERAYTRAHYDDVVHHSRERDAWLGARDLRDPRDFRELEHDLIYVDERERLLRERERAHMARDWKTEWDVPRTERDWVDTGPTTGRGNFGPKRGGGSNNVGVTKVPQREARAGSEPDWDADEQEENANKAEAAKLREVPAFVNAPPRDAWNEHDQRDKPTSVPRPEHADRRWAADWHEEEEVQPRIINPSGPTHHRGRGYRRGMGSLDHGDRGQGTFHGGSPRFPSKRSMTYTNPNIIKKQQAAQASAVAAATTAVAAAKAAAQSAANATTNPGILGQVSGVRQQGQISAIEKLEAGEIGGDIESPLQTEADPCTKPTENTISASTNIEKIDGELSEISDSDDEILTKTEKKSKDDSDTGEGLGIETKNPEKEIAIAVNELSVTAVTIDDNKPEEDEMLDFEEISDGELEEDARNKGWEQLSVGDALGVDWASLIAETKRQAENEPTNASGQPTTAKQKWQPHRIILDIGISMRMAGEEYAKRLLNDAQQKLNEELSQGYAKKKFKQELVAIPDDDSQTQMDTDDNTNDTEMKMKLVHKKTADELNGMAINVDRLHPLACVQVAERKNQLIRQNLIANACGANSRALSARQDLKLRRQLCGLPARECDFPQPMPSSSKNLKALALAAFQSALEVK